MCLCTNPSCYTSTLVARVAHGKVSEASRGPGDGSALVAQEQSVVSPAHSATSSPYLSRGRGGRRDVGKGCSKKNPQGIEETAVPAKTSTAARPSTAERMEDAADSTVGEPTTSEVEHLDYFTFLPRRGVSDVAESTPDKKLGEDHSHAEGSDPPPVIHMDYMYIKADMSCATCGCGLSREATRHEH
eukprot:5617912-Amphidinium_carterae.1